MPRLRPKPILPIIQDLLDEIEATGLTDKQICTDFDIARSSLTLWRSGMNRPSLEMLCNLSDRLNLIPRLLTKEPKDGQQ